MTFDWLEDEHNSRLVAEIRDRISCNSADVFIFRGAGLSYGVDRGRALFEFEEYDDGGRFPSWPILVNRMRDRVASFPEF